MAAFLFEKKKGLASHVLPGIASLAYRTKVAGTFNHIPLSLANVNESHKFEGPSFSEFGRYCWENRKEARGDAYWCNGIFRAPNTFHHHGFVIPCQVVMSRQHHESIPPVPYIFRTRSVLLRYRTRWFTLFVLGPLPEMDEPLPVTSYQWYSQSSYVVLILNSQFQIFAGEWQPSTDGIIVCVVVVTVFCLFKKVSLGTVTYCEATHLPGRTASFDKLSL